MNDLIKVSSSKNIALIGSGGNAKVLLDILEIYDHYHVLGYFDQQENKLFDIKYLGNDDCCILYQNDIFFINTIGSVKNTHLRQNVFQLYKEHDCQFLSLYHPSAYISKKAELSEGCLVYAMSIVQTNCKIGKNVLINHRVVIDHDSSIGHHTHIAPGCIIGGNVTIGENCHIGSGSIILQNITIGDHVTIGAGSLVNRNIPSHVLAFGTPCQIRI